MSYWLFTITMTEMLSHVFSKIECANKSIGSFCVFLQQSAYPKTFLDIFQIMEIAEPIILHTYDLPGLRALRDFAMHEHLANSCNWRYAKMLGLIMGRIANATYKSNKILGQCHRNRRDAEDRCHICGIRGGYNRDHVSTHFTTGDAYNDNWELFNRSYDCEYCREWLLLPS